MSNYTISSNFNRCNRSNDWSVLHVNLTNTPERKGQSSFKVVKQIDRILSSERYSCGNGAENEWNKLIESANAINQSYLEKTNKYGCIRKFICRTNKKQKKLQNLVTHINGIKEEIIHSAKSYGYCVRKPTDATFEGALLYLADFKVSLYNTLSHPDNEAFAEYIKHKSFFNRTPDDLKTRDHLDAIATEMGERTLSLLAKITQLEEGVDQNTLSRFFFKSNAMYSGGVSFPDPTIDNNFRDCVNRVNGHQKNDKTTPSTSTKLSDSSSATSSSFFFSAASEHSSERDRVDWSKETITDYSSGLFSARISESHIVNWDEETSNDS